MADHIIHSTDGQTYDRTTNRIPFGLLPKDVQEAMKAWPHGWEMYGDYGPRWNGVTPAWRSNAIYRAISAPKVGERVLYWGAKSFAATYRTQHDTTHRIIIRDDGKGSVSATMEKL